MQLKFISFIKNMLAPRILPARQVSSVPGIVKGDNSILTAKIELRHPAGTVHIGSNCAVAGRLYLNTEKSSIHIGDNVHIGGETIIESAASITIHNDVLISYQCILQDTNSHSLCLSKRIHDNVDWNRHGRKDWNLPVSSPVVIGRGCWIGVRAIILKGVHLGEGCIVGAASVVTKSFPAWSIIAGNPAKLIRTLREDER